ncbi:hypothetical protein B0H16DRAFT_1787454 [Mycena metata]|uniref:BRCT domain-containing protein n=1 Tax=Mycena metata TaxID=1033252 RepID=A0AAD7JM46_9AGAR|nr:hypothetical protein B0H16DRAFT_1787454 [Mycena metata]
MITRSNSRAILFFPHTCSPKLMALAIFQGVEYYIDACCNADQIARLLDIHGGKRTRTRKLATRIIVEPAGFKMCAREKKKEGLKAILVTPEWVYSSVKAGNKQPPQHYSPDPSMFFSSVIISAVGLSDSQAASIGAEVARRGGQWLTTLTDNVTHLISKTELDFPASDNFYPIHVSHRWVLESLGQGFLLPAAPFEFSPSHEHNNPFFSAARRFCQSIVSQTNAHTTVSISRRTIRLRGPRLPVLPFEVLSTIFIEFRDITLDSLHPMAALLPISQVSTRWRTIAHSTTALWAHMTLEFHTQERFDCLHQLIGQWAARSQPRPLSVTVRSCYPATENPIIHFILSHASRIRDLSLNLPEDHFHPLLKAPAGSFLVLEALTLTIIQKEHTIYDPTSGLSRAEYFRYPPECNDDPDEGILWDSLHPQLNVLANLPSLRTITIDSGGSYTNLDPHMLPLLWHNLSTIDFSSLCINVLDTAYLLLLCTGTQTLRFSTDNDVGDSMPPIAVVTLPLTSLEWIGFDVNAHTIFAPLTLPLLTTLDLRAACEETVLSLYERSSFALQSLKLCFTYVSFLPFSAFLRTMPSLTVLELYTCIDITDGLLTFLTHDEGRRVLPQLKRLIICRNGSRFSASVLLQMIESRWGSTPLAAVRIEPMTKGAQKHTGFVCRIVELIEEGLEFGHDFSWLSDDSVSNSSSDEDESSGSADEHSSDSELDDPSSWDSVNSSPSSG